MARMQFNPASRQRGFRKTSISRASIDRMREESNRIVSHMEKQQRAREEQADRDAAAMKENAEFTLRQMEENHQIKLANLGVEGDKIRGEAEAERRQQEIDDKQMTDILEGLVDFVPKAANYIAEKKEEYIQEQIKKANDEAEPHNYSLYSEEHREAERARANRDQAGELYDADIEEQHASGGMSLTDKLRGTASNPAVDSKIRQHNTNREFLNIYNNSRSQLLRENQEITTKSGLTFNAVDALSDSTLARELHRHVLSDTLNFFNVKRSYVGESLDILNKRHEVDVQRATREMENQARELALSNADSLFSMGDTTSILQGMQIYKRVEGAAAMHDRVEKLGSDLSIDLEQLDQANPLGDGKRYSEEWPNRWNKVKQNRVKAEREQAKAENQILKANMQTWEIDNYENIRELMRVDPEGTIFALQERYAKTVGTSVPARFKTLYNNAVEDKKDVLETELEQRTQFGTLDLTFVNNIDDPDVQKKAREAFETQQLTKYGEEGLGILNSLTATARKLTELNPNEKVGNPQTFLVEAKLKQVYTQLLKDLQDPRAANARLQKIVTAGINREDIVGDDFSMAAVNNPFYKDPSGPNNRPVFVNIERSDPERVERRNYVNNQLIELGAEVIDKPFALANHLEMDATYQSAVGGRVQYPIGILMVAEKFNMKPSQVFNRARKANNRDTGSTKPYIDAKSSNIIQTIDDVPLNIRKLILSDIPALIRRGGAQQSKTVSQYRRPSMGGGVSSTGMRGLADLVSSGEGGPTSMFPGENYPEMGNMSIREVVAFQKEKLRDGRASAAVGSYQFLYPEVAAQRAGLSLDDKFTPENQLKMFYATLLNKPGRENVSAYLQGRGGNIERAIDELAQEFASIEYRNGRSYYNDGVNKASISRDQVRAALLSAREEYLSLNKQ